jgi:hypothetical protein
MALSGHAVSVGSGADDVAGLDWTTGAVGDGERGGVGAMVTARGGVGEGGPPRARAPTATPPTARTTAARRARRGGFTDE